MSTENDDITPTTFSLKTKKTTMQDTKQSMSKEERKKQYNRLRYKKKKLEENKTFRLNGIEKLNHQIEILESRKQYLNTLTYDKRVEEQLKRHVGPDFQKVMKATLFMIEPNLEKILDLCSSDDTANSILSAIKARAYNILIDQYKLVI